VIGLATTGNLTARDLEPREAKWGAVVGAGEGAVEIVPRGYAEGGSLQCHLGRRPCDAKWAGGFFAA